MKILYFAWLAERLGISEETIALDMLDEPNVSGLIALLGSRYPEQKNVLEDTSILRVAVNQRLVDRACSLQSEDEIALFPPMTGG